MTTTLENLRETMRQAGTKYIYLSSKERVFGLSDCPNAGPNPNITGMRSLYWGKDALIVKQGQYAYKIG